MTFDELVLYYLIGVNIFNLFLFGFDKFFAIQGWRRVPEKVLWLISLLGGSVGGLLGMELWKHKRRKLDFILIMKFPMKGNKKRVIMENYGKLEDLDRSFDIQYWQAQTPADRFKAAWEMVEFVYQLKAKPTH